ncbi:MAG: substrate-binding domain-containing protein [Oscillospiraceae bacterium]|nr:substrate-binding domain-containing protein [Oscillospiraceae bacterium]
MKKLLVLLLAVLLVFTACSEVPEKPEVPESSSKPEAEQIPVPEVPKEGMDFLRENFPKIDGSTSLIPLEAGIRAEIFGKTIEEATNDVVHTTTYGSFYELVRGNVDMVFSCPLSEEQREAAKKDGIVFEEIPIAYEGFVFVVNANNPVDVLTQEQLRDIYSGKITNWKEVGGNDAEIIAYQRNSDSGSQNYMTEFMGEVPLMEAPEEARPSSMVGLMNAIALNDNAENAIGYSVYAYAADMYSGGDGIKFIKVDGAEVNKNNMAKGIYPLCGYNYAVFNSEEPTDSPVRKLVEWILSDEGQLAVAKAGYVTVRDIGFDYTEKTFEKYEGTGTGKISAEDKIPSFEYTLGTGLSECVPLEVKTHPDGTETYYLDALTDKELEAEVNEFICESIKAAWERSEQMKADLEALAKADPAHKIPCWEDSYFYSTRDPVYKKGQPAAVYATAKNGYLSVAVTMDYMDYGFYEGAYVNYHAETAVWDMESGKRLSTEELFREGTDIAKVLNEYMTLAIYQPINDLDEKHKVKTEFVSMPKEGWSMTADHIYFDFENPFFEGGARLETDTLLDRYMVTSEPDNMEGCFTELEPVKFFRDGTRNIVFKKLEKTKDENLQMISGFGYAVLRDAYKNSEKINKSATDYAEKYFSAEAIAKELGIKDSTDYSGGWLFVDAKLFGDKYFLVLSNTMRPFEGKNSDRYELSKTPTQIFNIETGKRIDFSDMLSKTGKKRAKAEGFDKFDIIRSFHLDGTEIEVTFIERKNYDQVTVILREEDINW